jgi:serine/tyrosine/threonine adenylyltransferase
MTSAPAATSDRPLDALRWDHRFTTLLPADSEPTNRRRQVIGAAFSRVVPTPVSAPRTLAWSQEVAALLGLPEELVGSQDFAEVFGGNRVPSGADPFAMCYGGHQFGNWAGQLGDGRAIAIGEMIDTNGNHQTLQLKGPGPTPYSRTADGRAVLRSSIREFLCSEAMFHLGVATTRALSLVSTGDPVMRDMLYDGNPAPEPGAIVCRVSPSFTRFGNFQLPASRGDLDLLRALVTTTIATDFPDLVAGTLTFEEQVVAFFREVVVRTAALAVDWMRVGFVHGVLNTDNMSILGLTIDFGPYGWLENYDPDWTPNTTDASQRRYRYGMQPAVMGWNLAQLANALVPLVGSTEPLQEALDQYRVTYGERFASMTATRMGWGSPLPGDSELINDLHALFRRTETDYLIFHRNLAAVPIDTTGAVSDSELVRALMDAYYLPDELSGDLLADTAAWLRRWAARVVEGGVIDAAERRSQMNGMNPKFVLRNWIAQEVIDAATAGDPSMISTVLEILRHPYEDQPGREHWAQRRPDWARTKVGCSMLSCSS